MLRVVERKSKQVVRREKQPKEGDSAPKEKYAPKSDAPFRSLSRLVIGAVHFAVLIGIVALLVSYGMQALQSSQQRAVVKVVAPNMHTVAAPYSGQFRASRPFSKGEWVRAGEVLGIVENREISDQLRAAKRRFSNLQREILLATASQSTRTSSNEPLEIHQQHIRQLRLDANAVQSEIARLSELEENLTVRSPIDGRVWHGLTGSRNVLRHEDIAPIWPQGSDLRIEIQAPLGQIDSMLQNGTVECRFATPGGEQVVTAKPILSTRETLLAENEKNRSDKQILGRIECVPENGASRNLLPGWVGTL